MKKKILFAAIALLVIGIAFAAGYHARGLQMYAILSSLPGPACADAATGTCSQTMQSLYNSCASDCGGSGWISAGFDANSCKTGCVLYKTYLGACKGQIVN